MTAAYQGYPASVTKPVEQYASENDGGDDAQTNRPPSKDMQQEAEIPFLIGHANARHSAASLSHIIFGIT